MRRLTITVRACTETLGLLVAMAWADGQLDPEEKEGIRAAAATLNLPKELRDRIESFMEVVPDLCDFKLDALSDRERSFAFVASAWLANLAKGVDAEEQALLNDLGEALELDPKRQQELTKIALEMAPPPKGESWSTRIEQLFRSIPPKIEPAAEDSEVEFV